MPLPQPLAPALVLLPGLDGTARLFGRLTSCLDDGDRVTSVAYPVDRCTSRSELLELIAAAIPPEGDYVLVAESFSGSLAIEHAAPRPERLKALVLVASFAANPLPRPLRWLRLLAGATRMRLPDSLLRFALVGGDAPPELVREVGEAIRSARPKVLVHRLRQVFDVDARGQLPDLAVPVLYLRGSHDRLVGGRGLAPCAEHIQDLTIEVIDGPHLLLQARPQECAEAIERFLHGADPIGAPFH